MDDEAGEQASQTRPDQAGNGERRPRRRGRRGGRRRRGGPEDGLAGSISDELNPVAAPEVESAVADFDGVSEPPVPAVEHISETHPAAATVQPQEPSAAETDAHAAEQEKAAARRRSTVREKVSFAAPAHSPLEPAAAHSLPQPAAPAETPAEAASETSGRFAAPRRMVVATLRRRLAV